MLASPKSKGTVWPVNPKTGKRRRAGGIEDLEEILGGSDTNRGPSAGIRPKGRAPRGRGKEFAARRAIANKIEHHQAIRDGLQAKVNRYRGQANKRRDITYSKLRITELNKAIDVSAQIANGPGDWGFKRELVNGVFDHASQSTAVR